MNERGFIKSLLKSPQFRMRWTSYPPFVEYNSILKEREEDKNRSKNKTVHRIKYEVEEK